MKEEEEYNILTIKRKYEKIRFLFLVGEGNGGEMEVLGIDDGGEEAVKANVDIVNLVATIISEELRHNMKGCGGGERWSLSDYEREHRGGAFASGCMIDSMDKRERILERLDATIKVQHGCGN